MEKLIKLFCVVLIALSATLPAIAADGDDFTYEGITYTVISEADKTCETKEGSSSYAGNEVAGDVVIPETVYNSSNVAYTVVKLGNCAFYSCTGLTSIAIPNSVTSIGESAFYSCRGLTSVAIPNSVTSIGDNAFVGCRSLTSIDIPNSVTYIGVSAFSGCRGLTSVAIPNSVTSIGGGTFSSCSSLTSVVIPNSVTSIGDGVFWNCTGLTSVAIPNSVTSIGPYAFYGCTGITEFYSYSIFPPVCGDQALGSIDKQICTLYVPAESMDEYKAADQWKDFNHILAIALEVAEIRLDKTEASIKVGETFQLIATVLPAEAAETVLTWSSSDESVATVSATGLVTAVSLGSATITVSSGDATAICTVEVTDEAGIDDVLIDGNNNVEVYTLQGVRLNISTREELSKLTTGFYIVNGEKVLVK